MSIAVENARRLMTRDDAAEAVAAAAEKLDLKNKRVLAIIPDGTRTAPIAMLFEVFQEIIGVETKQLDFMIALGTHPPMDEAALEKHFALGAEERKQKYPSTEVFNHNWSDPDQLKTIGVISAEETAEITGGLMREEFHVQINKKIFEYDLLLILGPTFPHEVMGYSGGNKYLFPGISGPEIINTSHWLSALVSNRRTIGFKKTPMRALIDRAATFISVPKFCFSLVTTPSGLHGIHFGTPEEAFSAAADHSSQVNVIEFDRPFDKVLSVAPEMYYELWVAGKCMYKLENAVADGGELIIYAPHVKRLSATHGEILERIGFHVAEYFTAQPEKFVGVPRGPMAHSVHVKGDGTYRDGVERPRIKVSLASSIPEDFCRKVNLDYIDPNSINPDEWRGREDEGVLMVPRAGEILHRVKPGA